MPNFPDDYSALEITNPADEDKMPIANSQNSDEMSMIKYSSWKALFERLVNKITSWGTPNDTQYPSAKLTKDTLDLKEVLTNKETSALDTSTTKYPCNNVVKNAVESNMPSGSIIQYAGIAEPSGFKFCNGQALSRTTYATLYNLITSAKGTFTVTLGASAVFTLNTHGLVTGDCVELTTTGALYTGLTVNTNYWVIYKTANEFYLATTMANAIAGTKITTSGSQSGVHSLRFCPFEINTSANFLTPDMRGRYPKGVGVSVIANDLGAYPTGLYGQMKPDYLKEHKHETEGLIDIGSGGNVAADGNNYDTGTFISNGIMLLDVSNINEPPSLCVNFIIKT